MNDSLKTSAGQAGSGTKVQGGYQNPSGFSGKTAGGQMQSQSYIFPDSLKNRPKDNYKGPIWKNRKFLGEYYMYT